MDIIHDCSKGCFDYDHYDVNKRMKIPVNFSRVNIRNAMRLLNTYAQNLKIETLQSNSNNLLCNKISNCLY